MEKVALYAGSFDPITNGHLNIIERASKVFDKLIVCVVVNPNKHALFTRENRIAMIAKCTEHLNNVEIDAHDGLLADYVNENNIDVLIRGLRNTDDFNNEMTMAHINEGLFEDGTEIVFFMAEPEHTHVSSSAVKEIALLGGSIKGLVPECIETEVKHMEE